MDIPSSESIAVEGIVSVPPLQFDQAALRLQQEQSTPAQSPRSQPPTPRSLSRKCSSLKQMFESVHPAQVSHQNAQVVAEVEHLKAKRSVADIKKRFAELASHEPVSDSFNAPLLLPRTGSRMLLSRHAQQTDPMKSIPMAQSAQPHSPDSSETPRPTESLPDTDETVSLRSSIDTGNESPKTAVASATPLLIQTPELSTDGVQQERGSDDENAGTKVLIDIDVVEIVQELTSEPALGSRIVENTTPLESAVVERPRDPSTKPNLEPVVEPETLNEENNGQAEDTVLPVTVTETNSASQQAPSEQVEPAAEQLAQQEQPTLAAESETIEVCSAIEDLTSQNQYLHVQLADTPTLTKSQSESPPPIGKRKKSFFRLNLGGISAASHDNSPRGSIWSPRFWLSKSTNHDTATQAAQPSLGSSSNSSFHQRRKFSLPKIKGKFFTFAARSRRIDPGEPIMICDTTKSLEARKSFSGLDGNPMSPPKRHIRTPRSPSPPPAHLRGHVVNASISSTSSISSSATTVGTHSRQASTASRNSMRHRSWDSQDASYMSWANTRSKKDKVLKSGWLRKKSSLRNQWKRFYCMLYLDRLEYYKDEKMKKHVCDILLRNAVVTELPSKTKITDYCFSVTWRNRDTFFYADSRDEFIDWVESIRTVLRMQYSYKAPN